MSKGTGIKGYTPDRLRRSQEAAKRLEEHDGRTAEEQLKLIAARPGESRHERMKLERALVYEQS